MTYLRMLNLLLIIGLASGAVGCANEPKQTVMPDQNKLFFDPTEAFELTEWWSNGNELLRLSDDASYAVYPEENRYRQPLERGQWSQLTHAALLFEPYRIRNNAPRRIAIEKVDDGVFQIVVPGLRPMSSRAFPPTTGEDAVIGKWETANGMLMLDESMRYRFEQHDPSQTSANAKITETGDWLVMDNAVILSPDSISREAREIGIDGAGEEATLSGFRHVE